MSLPNLTPEESIHDIKINPDLSDQQKKELLDLVSEFADVITDIPGHTNLIEHDIKLTSNEPVRPKPYTVPFALHENIKKRNPVYVTNGYH